MENQVAVLVELQRAETTLKGILSRKNKIPAQLAELEEERKKQEGFRDEAKALVASLLAKQKEKEEALVKAGDELRKTKSKQFEVKTNKEFEAVLKELEGIEKKIGSLEEGIILLFDEMEKGKSDLQASEVRYEERLKEYEEAKRVILANSSECDGQMTELSVIQGDLKKSLTAENLKKYEAIKGLHGGVAVAAVVKGICQGCFVNIPPQMNNELIKAKEIRFCPRCNRIIFYQAPKQEEAQ